jgi:hypothetical protein
MLLVTLLFGIAFFKNNHHKYGYFSTIKRPILDSERRLSTANFSDPQHRSSGIKIAIGQILQINSKLIVHLS